VLYNMEKKKNINEVMQEINYGQIILKLDKILKERNITTYELSNSANIRFQTVKALREDTATRIDFNVLAKICYALNCKVQDIIEYKENKK